MSAAKMLLIIFAKQGDFEMILHNNKHQQQTDESLIMFKWTLTCCQLHIRCVKHETLARFHEQIVSILKPGP